MRKRSSRILAGAFAVAGLLLASGSAWAGSPAERSVQRQQNEQRITALQDRLAQIQPQTRIAAVHLKTATVLTTQAQRLASHNQQAAAKLTADLAERFVARAEGKPLYPINAQEVLK